MDFPSYALYEESDTHDPDGIIFVRRLSTPAEGLDLGQTQNVSWFKAGALTLNPLELYVRMYTSVEGGEKVPSHYVRMDIIQEMVNYHSFCINNGLQYKPTLDHYNEIVQAINDFYEVFSTELG